jgi:hypothetical protein
MKVRGKIMIANLEQTLIEKIHVLPKEKQAKVLEFIEEIEVTVSISGDNKNDIDEETLEKHRRRMRLVGIASSKSGTVSQRVDEILAEGINKREGWSLP